jgi:hypothetical protein
MKDPILEIAFDPAAEVGDGWQADAGFYLCDLVWISKRLPTHKQPRSS